MKRILLILSVALLSQGLFAQDANEIIKGMEENFRGSNNISTMKMSIVRPKYTREITLKSWNIGEEFSLIRIQDPAREKGVSFLKREKEIWNWMPSIERVIKMPPSMMMQSWMGSDFTNDDLVRSSSIIDDYDAEIIAEEEIDGHNCYKIQMVPKEGSDILWGKVLTWITVEDNLQLRSEFWDEDDYLVNTIEMSGIKEMDGRTITTKMVMSPEEEDGLSTIIEFLEIDFDADLKESFFTVQNMKRMR